jgi:hypothetical protein
MQLRIFAISAAFGLGLVGAAGATTYTSDPVLSHFTAGETYATFTNYFNGDAPPGTYTPTNATLNERVYQGGAVPGLDPTNNWILATFGGPTASIRVFENEDHYGDAYDGYQYQIYGRNAAGGWDFLFNALTVAGAGEPYTLGSFAGTAPTSVNNVLSNGGPVAYIADFTFANAYSVFAFGASTEAINAGNPDDEFSAIGRAAIPEPMGWTLMITGIGLAGAALRRRRTVVAPTAA